MTKLREAGIQALLIAGHHDAASQLTRHLRLPDNVTLFPVAAPQSVLLEHVGVVVHGQGFPSRAVTQDLSARYPKPIPHLFNIGLLHTSVDGRDGHEPYAPCTTNGLVSKDYDYWALGHVHTREVIHQDPWILFPGNMQGRHVRKCGSKGCTLVTVQGNQVISATPRDLDVLRWSVCEVDVSGARTGDDVVDHLRRTLGRELTASDGRPLAVRIQLLGACQAYSELSLNPDRWTNEIRATATDLSNGTIWIEQVRLHTRTELDLDQVLARDDALSDLLRVLLHWDTDEAFLGEVTKEFCDLYRKLPPELRTGDGMMDLEQPQALRQVVEDVKHLLFARLLLREDGR